MGRPATNPSMTARVEVSATCLETGGCGDRQLALLFPPDKIGRSEKPVLQVVDPKLRRLLVGHDPDVSGDLEPPPVGRVDRRRSHIAAHVDVELEGGETVVRPIVDELGRIHRPADRMHLGDQGRRALDVGRGQVQLGSWHLAGIDPPLDLQVGIRLDRAPGADGRQSAGEVEPREGVVHLVHVKRPCPGPHRVEEVLVHHDEAGNDGLAGQVDDARVARDRNRAEGPERGDSSVPDEQRLVLAGGRVGRIDETGVNQGDEGGAQRDLRTGLLGGHRGGSERGGGRKPAAEKRARG